jgi:hypothetical protein
MRRASPVVVCVCLLAVVGLAANDATTPVLFPAAARVRGLLTKALGLKQPGLTQPLISTGSASTFLLKPDGWRYSGSTLGN